MVTLVWEGNKSSHWLILCLSHRQGSTRSQLLVAFISLTQDSLSPSCKGKREGSGVHTRTLSVVALLILFLRALASLSTEEGSVAHAVTSLSPTSTRGGAAAPHSPGLPLPIHWRQKKRRETDCHVPNVICNRRRWCPKMTTGTQGE